MARSALTVESTNRSTGLNLSLESADSINGHYFANASEDVILVVKNASGSSITVTIVTPVTLDGIAVADLTITVTDGETRYIGPFPKSLYNRSDGSVQVDISADTSVTLAAWKLGTKIY